jgi:hypothetical protein
MCSSVNLSNAFFKASFAAASAFPSASLASARAFPVSLIGTACNAATPSAF